jgi:hypothetical protein
LIYVDKRVRRNGVMPIPVIIKPIEVKLTLRAIDVQIGHITIVISIVPNGTDEKRF